MYLSKNIYLKIYIGLQNYKLKWKGPYGRRNKWEKYPKQEDLQKDTEQASTVGCDIVIFLVFNDFSSGQDTDGHKYSGFAVGAPCEAAYKSGYTVVKKLKTKYMHSRVLSYF